MANFFFILFSAIFIENFVFVKFYGLCPFFGTTKSVKSAFKIGLTVVFVMTLSAFFIWPVNRFLFIPFDLEFLSTPAHLLIIAVLVQILEMILAKRYPALYTAMGIYLPLTCVNCAILAALRTVITDFSLGFADFFGAVFYCFAVSVGFLFSLVLFAGIRKRIQEEDIPQSFRGLPIALISAGLCAIAFYAFSLLNF